MTPFRLEFDIRVIEFERSNRWKSAVKIVMEQWRASPHNLNLLLCAGTQLWYTLLVMDDINDVLPPVSTNIEIEMVSPFELQNELMTVTRTGFELLTDNALFNSYFGHMISVMPYYFLEYKGDYDKWQTMGKEMLKRAYLLEPHNPFAKAMFYSLEAYNNNTLFHDACKEFWRTITPAQWGSSEVQQYFFRILRGDIFFPEWEINSRR